MIESTTLVAPAISCENCQRAVEEAVSKLEGVQTVKVDILTKSVRVEYDPQKATVTKIEEVMDDIGYTVAK